MRGYSVSYCTVPVTDNGTRTCTVLLRTPPYLVRYLVQWNVVSDRHFEVSLPEPTQYCSFGGLKINLPVTSGDANETNAKLKLASIIISDWPWRPYNCNSWRFFASSTFHFPSPLAPCLWSIDQYNIVEFCAHHLIFSQNPISIGIS